MSANGKKYLSPALIAVGAVLLFLGARDFIESIVGQREASRHVEKSRQKEGGEGVTAPDLGSAVAVLSIPRLQASWFVFPGAGKKVLRRGPGLLPGTAMPGTRGNAVIAAHRDTHFRVLKDIQKGDDLLVETRQGRFRYEVSDISIVKPTNTKALQPTTEPVMNLITCYPFYYIGSAPKRFIVEARLAAVEIAYTPTTSRGPS